MRDKALHIVFTGIDGAGKSTVAGKLAKSLQDDDRLTYFTESKDDLVIQLSSLVAGRHRSSPRDYFGNFAFDFAKSFDVVRHYHRSIAPMLHQGAVVIEPRSVYCRLGLALLNQTPNLAKIEEIYRIVPPPDMVFWIQVPPTIAYQRVRARGIDDEPLDHLQRFDAALTHLAAPDWIPVDGSVDAEKAVKFVREAVSKRLL